ncbi:MAG: TIGR04168 family protein [cyanobacterium endosymbiont of Rhopalodia musculus]|uniref:TIGR04168 family protein n=1 Tax=cyanobacterium endosymbiont of Epithemia clementina EcSB TaxID=3034674 RepID=UPI002480E804|nr:TIGR04168 family protein [cyanobacterium endosymbiont of Epithemia clementina EcSB]WGT68462.1 TIGR04168 family protein [cyanobacterium endosymbiont of Epithemia clementina EcSB]
MAKYSKQKLTIAVVGDIHGQWEEDDNLALENLGVDLVLFVGDFGNEAVSIVRLIANLDLPKAAIMGNHDAWYTASDWGREQCPYDRTREDWLQAQLDLLGTAHVGYAKLDFVELNLSVVGSRPYSWGGSQWKNKSFLRDHYGVTSFAESTAKIVAAAQQATYNTIVLLGHNGPTGLGEEPEAICGRDWKPLGGDHGDPDLAQAIIEVHALGKHIPLVTFGHMHHRLRYTNARLRIQVEHNSTKTIYLNAASVPRYIEKDKVKLRNFSLVSLNQGEVREISLVWVDPDGMIASQECLYRHQDAIAPGGAFLNT